MSDVYDTNSNPDDDPGENMREALRGAEAGRDRRQTDRDVDVERRQGERRKHPRVRD